MRNFLLLLSMLFCSLQSHAQFQEGKGYIGASISGLDLNWNDNNGFKIGINAKAGYFLQDDWMALAFVGLNKQHTTSLEVGVGGRYYIEQNGLYLGMNCKYIHANHSYNDLMPGAEVGYAFFVNRSVTIEPSVYYDHSFNSSKYSTVGVKIGIGIYLFDD